MMSTAFRPEIVQKTEVLCTNRVECECKVIEVILYPQNKFIGHCNFYVKMRYIDGAEILKELTFNSDSLTLQRGLSLTL